jgi:phosphatidylglycerophosphate synthase
MDALPYDQRAARAMVKPLARLGVSPNHVTALTLLLAVAGAALFVTGEAIDAYWGAFIFVVARFLDHFDGELARLTGKTSRFGYYFDYAVGGLSYGALFASLGIGLAQGPLGGWALLLGAAGTASALLSLVLNLKLDREEALAEGDAIGYPRLAGFELEDGIYLLAPLAWLGFLTPFFVAAGIGAAVYCLWTLGRVVAVRLRTRL